jgi:lactate dehydrogenase-like 2-hydroxyacid dehydrogenase
LRDRLTVEVWDQPGAVPRGVLLKAMARADGLLCMITEDIDVELLEAAPSLRVVSQMAVGVDNIDLEACRDRGVAVGHTPGVLTETVADTAWALLAAVVRRLPEGEKLVRAGEWPPWEPFTMTGGDLHGTTIGIVGMGRIGQAIARRAAGFDMEVVYSSPHAKPDIEAGRLSLPDLLERSDHVVVCAALTDGTRGLIAREELRAMKSSAYLVNVARGPLVDTDALVDALGSGGIAGAALDVTDPEPLPPNHPLLEHPNCLVVPHVGSASVRTRTAMARMSVENLIAGLDGEDMPARCDLV